MIFPTIHSSMRCGFACIRRNVHFNARRLRSGESYSKYAQTIAFRRSFSVAGSRVNTRGPPLRRQDLVSEKAESDKRASNGKSPSTSADDISVAGSVSGGNEAQDSALEPSLQQRPTAEVSSVSSDPSSDDFLTTIFENLEPYVDTYDIYKQLTDAGFTPSQADEFINLLIFQLNSKLTKLSKVHSQLYELENEQYLFESAQQELHVDITRNREQHINDAINQINAMERDYGIISDELNNQFIQMKNDIQVSINDQKSENTLMSKRTMLRMQETNHKITTKLNMAMRLEIESLRWHLSRWGLIAILMFIVTACAGFYVYRYRHQKQMSEKNDFIPLVIYEPSELDEDDYHEDLDPNSL